MPKFGVNESVTIDKDLAHVRAIVRDFKQWVPWSPWLSAEPDCTLSYADDPPYFGSVCLAANALLLAGSDDQKAEYLPKLIEGQTGTLAWCGRRGGRTREAIEVTCDPDGDRYSLNGTCRYVIDGHTADWIVVAAKAGESSVSLFLVPGDAEGLSRQWLPTMDQTRKQAELVFENVFVAASQRLGPDAEAWPLLEQILDLATIALAAEQVGAAQQALDSTVAYTQERVQFGRTIASYQAVKHKAADMMVKVEAARSALYYAACIAQESLEGGPRASELAEAASIAKAWCSEACFFNAGCGIQLHGGVGFTWEYDIQMFFKRAQSSGSLLGDAAWHRERLAALLLDGEVA